MALAQVNEHSVFTIDRSPWFRKALHLLTASGVHGVAVDVWVRLRVRVGQGSLSLRGREESGTLPAQKRRSDAAMRALGAVACSQWGAVERSPGVYSWTGYQQLFELVKLAGLRVQVR